MKANPVGWFEIYVQDIARAQKFYEAVFQGERLSAMTGRITKSAEGFSLRIDYNHLFSLVVKRFGQLQSRKSATDYHYFFACFHFSKIRDFFTVKISGVLQIRHKKS